MTPEAHEDFVDVVRCLREEGCDFLIVGAYAFGAGRAAWPTTHLACAAWPRSSAVTSSPSRGRR